MLWTRGQPHGLKRWIARVQTQDEEMQEARQREERVGPLLGQTSPWLGKVKGAEDLRCHAPWGSYPFSSCLQVGTTHVYLFIFFFHLAILPVLRSFLSFCVAHGHPLACLGVSMSSAPLGSFLLERLLRTREEET